MADPREPDRFDKLAEEIWRACLHEGDSPSHKPIAAALRAEHEATLERAAQEADAEAAEYHADAKRLDSAGRADAGTQSVHGELGCRAVARRIRALKEPATAPAAETGPAEICRAEVATRMPDYSHYECTLPKGHAGPHREHGTEWTDATTVAQTGGPTT